MSNQNCMESVASFEMSWTDEFIYFGNSDVPLFYSWPEFVA